MGVIQRQGIKQSIVNYIGVAIGGFSVIFIYPLMSNEKLGVLQFIVNASVLFAPFVSFGMSTSAIQFFQEFKTESKNHNGYLFLLVTTTLCSAVLVLSGIYFFRNSIAYLFGENAPTFLSSLPYVLGFTLVNSFIFLFISYCSLFNRIVVPNIFQNLVPKITQPTFVILYVMGLISFSTVLNATGVVFIVTLTSIIVYIYFLNQNYFKPHWNFYTSERLVRIFSYSGFNILVGIGALLSNRIDQFFIAPIVGFAALPIFNFGLFIAEAMDVPRKSITSISAPLLSEAIKKNNFEEVQKIYQKSCDVLLLVGTLLFVLVVINMDSLFNLMPKNGELYRNGKSVIILLCLSRLFDMATGTNGEIITFSGLYKFNLYSLGLLSFLTVALNILFLPTLGITGSALATFIAMVIFNVGRVEIIRRNFGFQPFHIGMLKVLLIGVVCFAIGYSIPSVHHAAIDIALRSFIVTLLYGIMIVRFNLSEDVDEIWKKIRGQF